MSSKPLVAIVCGLMNPIPPVKAGGPQLVIWNTCKHLNDAEFDWKVLSLWDEAVENVDFDRERFVQVRIGKKEEKISQFAQKMPYRMVKGWFGVVRPDHLALNLAMVRELKRMKPDVVIVHESYSLCFMVARALPKAKIVFYHHICRMHIDLTKRSWERLLRASNAGIIAINSRAIPMAVGAFGSRPNADWVVLNGVDNRLLNNQINNPADSFSKLNLFTFLYVGRINPIKGLDTLVDAMKIVSEQLPGKVRLHIIGAAGIDEGGEQVYEDQLKQRAESSTHDSIEFIGFIQNEKLIDYYSQADCGVLPTRLMEGNSLFLMECLAMGVPVIATGIGGVLDVIVTDEDGILIEEDVSPAKLAEHMMSVYKNRNWWKAGRAGRITRSRNRFNYERVATQISLIIDEILGHEN